MCGVGLAFHRSIATLKRSQPGSWLVSVMRPLVALLPSSNGKQRIMQCRRRFRQWLSLNDRLKMFSDNLKSGAEILRPGRERDALLMKARIADTAAEINEWVNSPGLRPPK
jgi:hypothetical protein